MLWLLAVLGAASSWLGDICGVIGVRRGDPRLILPTFILFGSAAPMWYALSMRTGGQFVKPALIWNVAASVLSLVAALALEGAQSPRQWVGLAPFFLALIIRG